MNKMSSWRSQDRKPKTKVKDCNTAERIILWAIRLWAAGNRSKTSVLPTIMEGFRQHGNAQAASNLIMLMESSVSGLTRNFEINCNCYVYVGKDEELILKALSICQNQLPKDIQPILSGFLSNEAISICYPLFYELSDSLMAGSLFLSESWVHRTLQASLDDPNKNYSASFH